MEREIERGAPVHFSLGPNAATVTADDPLRFLVVYTPPGESYFCAEPVSHCTDAFNLADRGRNDTGMIVLPPGKAASATVRFATAIERS